jgi:hypothetical protein
MSIVEEPRELDIIVGKEQKCRTHKGSLYFRAFVESYRQRYQDAKTKQLRTAISKEMYDVITQASCRFLKFNEQANGWQEICETASLDKITHALRYAQQREHRKHKRNVPQRSNSDTSRRSEGSSTSGTSFSSQATSYTAASLDLDALFAQEQKRLSAVNISSMNASLKAYRQSCRQPFASASASASMLDFNSNNNNSQNRRVSFVESSSLNSFTSTTASLSSAESIPLPVDLSYTQHLDMNQRLSRLPAEEKVDQPPRMPTRPMDDPSGSLIGEHQDFNVSCHSIVEETSSAGSTSSHGGGGDGVGDGGRDDASSSNATAASLSITNQASDDDASVNVMLNSLYLQDPCLDNTHNPSDPCGPRQDVLQQALSGQVSKVPPFASISPRDDEVMMDALDDDVDLQDEFVLPGIQYKTEECLTDSPLECPAATIELPEPTAIRNAPAKSAGNGGHFLSDRDYTLELMQGPILDWEPISGSPTNIEHC